MQRKMVQQTIQNMLSGTHSAGPSGHFSPRLITCSDKAEQSFPEAPCIPPGGAPTPLTDRGSHLAGITPPTSLKNSFCLSIGASDSMPCQSHRGQECKSTLCVIWRAGSDGVYDGGMMLWKLDGSGRNWRGEEWKPRSIMGQSQLVAGNEDGIKDIALSLIKTLRNLFKAYTGADGWRGSVWYSSTTTNSANLESNNNEATSWAKLPFKVLGVANIMFSLHNYKQ